MELTIENKTYNFRFGIGFVRYLDGKSSIEQNGVQFGIGFVRYLDGKSSIEQNGVQFGIGLETLIPNLLTGNTVTLSDCLFVANRTENPRVTQEQLDNYIDNENTDIDGLFDDVLKELKKSNATKKKAKMLMKEYEEKMQETQDQAM